MKYTKIILLFVLVFLASFLAGDWFSKNVSMEREWTRQKMQNISRYLILYRSADRNNCEGMRYKISVFIYNEIMELKYFGLLDRFDADPEFNEARDIALRVEAEAIDVRDVFLSSPSVGKIE